MVKILNWFKPDVKSEDSRSKDKDGFYEDGKGYHNYHIEGIDIKDKNDNIVGYVSNDINVSCGVNIFNFQSVR